MSQQYFKITLHYDNNCGSIVEDTVLCEANNTIDYRKFFNDNGYELDFYGGTDSYCDALSYALRLKDHKEQLRDNWIGCEIKKISYKEFESIFSSN